MQPQVNQQPTVQVGIEPDVYATSTVFINSDLENFYFTIVSGNHGRRYQFTPGHAKRVLMLLQRQVEAYEKANGELKTSLPQTSPGQEPRTDEKKIGFHAQIN